jgi:hypothetical protein
MISAACKPNLAGICQRAVLEVLNTSLSFPATLHYSQPDGIFTGAPEQVTSQMPLSGPGLSAVVCLRFPIGFIGQAVERLTGLGADSAEATALREDTAGELANMVAGRVAAQLTASGYPCSLGTPSAVPDAASPATTGSGVDYARVSLFCEGHVLSVEIECRYKST